LFILFEPEIGSFVRGLGCKQDLSEILGPIDDEEGIDLGALDRGWRKQHLSQPVASVDR